MTTKAKYWDPIIERYATSGLTKIKFCKEHQLPYSQFCYHLTKSKTNNKSLEHSFEPIMIARKSMELKSSGKVIDLTVHLPNSMRLDMKIEQGNAFSVLLKELVALC
jgi:hypothetical protein